MAATNFKTENNTFRKLIGNGLTYSIPRFQRDYSWGIEEWEDLWTDISEALEDVPASPHYMGYLVLQSTDDKTFDVIDGQQRLTTVTIIVLAVLKNMQRLIDAGSDPEPNKRRLDQIRQTYIGYLDPVTLVARPKLSLNRNNNSYFQTYVVPLEKLPLRGFRASEHQLRKAFEWFDKKVSARLREEAGDEGRRLAKLVEDISDNLFFTVVTVTDELNAYKVFETLNARGVRLSATDLLKNYLFSVLDRSGKSDPEFRSLEERWENIVGRLQSEDFTDFLRAHWNSRRNFARKSDLFKAVRSNVGTPGDVFRLLRDMEGDLDTYLTLSSPEPSDWSQEDKKLAGILKTLRVRQPFPLLLAAKRVFDTADFTGLLRATVVVSMRLSIIGAYSPGQQESRYNEIARRIAGGELTALGPALQPLRAVYPGDTAFEAAFVDKTFRTTDRRNSRLVRFILCEIEKHAAGRAYDFANDAITIEHVLPQNAPDGWGGIGNNDAEALVYRLGNMTLLESGANRDAGAADYESKRDVYRRSGFVITRKLAEANAEWTPDRIAARQAWLASQATAIWRVTQFD